MILDKAAAVLKKDFITAVRHRNGFLMNVVSPAAQLATFYYLSRAIGPQFRPEGMPYFLFLVVGTGFYGFLLTGIYGLLRNIQEAQQSGTLEVLMTSSTPPPVLLTLSAVSGFAGAFVQFVIYVGAGSLLFAHAFHAHLLAAMAVLVFSLLIAAAIGITAVALQISVQKGSAVLWALGTTSWLMAGTLFPVAALPKSVRILSNLLPFTHSLAGMRLAMQGANSLQLTGEIEILFLFALALVPMSVVFFSWTVRRARQLGTLSFY